MKRQFDPAEPELMDRPQPVTAELVSDLRNLRQLNRYFGSYALTTHFLRRWIQPGTQLRVLDLATGSGDIPRLVIDYARKVGATVDGGRDRSAKLHPGNRARLERGLSRDRFQTGRCSFLRRGWTIRHRALLARAPSFRRGRGRATAGAVPATYREDSFWSPIFDEASSPPWESTF